MGTPYTLTQARFELTTTEVNVMIQNRKAVKHSDTNRPIIMAIGST